MWSMPWRDKAALYTVSEVKCEVGSCFYCSFYAPSQKSKSKINPVFFNTTILPSELAFELIFPSIFYNLFIHFFVVPSYHLLGGGYDRYHFNTWKSLSLICLRALDRKVFVFSSLFCGIRLPFDLSIILKPQHKPLLLIAILRRMTSWFFARLNLEKCKHV